MTGYNEPHHKKTVFRVVRPGKIQTYLQVLEFHIVTNNIILSTQQTTKALIRLRGRAVLNGINRFCHEVTQFIPLLHRAWYHSQLCVRFEPQSGHITFMKIDHEIDSMAVLSLPLIQAGQLSVTALRTG